MKYSGTLILALALPNCALAEVTIRLTTSEPPHVEVNDLSAEILAALTDARFDAAAWNRILALRVKSNSASALKSSVPVLGDYKIQDGKLVFTPRFPLKPGMAYLAVFDPSAVSGKPQGRNRVETVLILPSLPREDATAVDAIYPTSDVLPENQLKFYIHFSAPMSRGDSYRHIHLLDADGKQVDAPFLELAEELWDESGRRLTLLLDPGRVKQDLKPNKDVGRALTDGRAYTLLIDTEWRDAGGSPLASEFRKTFRVTKADIGQPDPRRWQLTPLCAGTRDPLVVRFNEPLDHAMLQHAIRVSSPAGKRVEGRVVIEQHETGWSFRPTTPWSSGRHRLLIDGTLEDLAGNSIARPFEVYLPGGRPTEADEYILPFQVLQASPGTDPSE